MNYRIEFVEELMTVADADGNGYDAFEVDPEQPWDAVEALAKWGREYSLDTCHALRELRAYLKDCE
ncbi:MAG: hypothetical protein L0228_10095 [Planctomycetes bacterium]|nr:hypothetical protein [Planctomycetota bacterium]